MVGNNITMDQNTGEKHPTNTGANHVEKDSAGFGHFDVHRDDACADFCCKTVRRPDPNSNGKAPRAQQLFGPREPEI